MSAFLDRWINRFYRKVPVVMELAQLPRGIRAVQESYLLSLLNQPRYQDPRHLAHFEHQVYSQNGEDGILAEIFRRIGTTDRKFLEIGVGNGLINNTAFLLAQGWSGWWVDGDAYALQRLRTTFRPQLESTRLRLREMYITAENIRGALEQEGVTPGLDLFSLDIDRNTYWIWEALPQLQARVVVVEYNASIPASMDWKVDYNGSQTWDGSFCLGASLKAYERLGNRLGYNLVGCDLTGTNAFLVRKDLCGDLFVGPFDAETHYEPPRFWLERTQGHPRSSAMFGKE